MMKYGTQMVSEEDQQYNNQIQKQFAEFQETLNQIGSDFKQKFVGESIYGESKEARNLTKGLFKDQLSEIYEESSQQSIIDLLQKSQEVLKMMTKNDSRDNSFRASQQKGNILDPPFIIQKNEQHSSHSMDIQPPINQMEMDIEQQSSEMDIEEPIYFNSYEEKYTKRMHDQHEMVIQNLNLGQQLEMTKNVLLQQLMAGCKPYISPQNVMQEQPIVKPKPQNPLDFLIIESEYHQNEAQFKIPRRRTKNQNNKLSFLIIQIMKYRTSLLPLTISEIKHELIQKYLKREWQKQNIPKIHQKRLQKSLKRRIYDCINIFQSVGIVTRRFRSIEPTQQFFKCQIPKDCKKNIVRYLAKKIKSKKQKINSQSEKLQRLANRRIMQLHINQRNRTPQLSLQNQNNQIHFPLNMYTGTNITIEYQSSAQAQTILMQGNNINQINQVQVVLQGLNIPYPEEEIFSSRSFPKKSKKIQKRRGRPPMKKDHLLIKKEKKVEKAAPEKLPEHRQQEIFYSEESEQMVLNDQQGSQKYQIQPFQVLYIPR